MDPNIRFDDSYFKQLPQMILRLRNYSYQEKTLYGPRELRDKNICATIRNEAQEIEKLNKSLRYTAVEITNFGHNF